MTKEELAEINDYELIMLYHENDEEVKNLIYLKYKFIIDILINKYKPALVSLNIDYQEIYSEASVGFSDALKNYKDNKDASLPTFITLCVERRLRGIVRKYNRDKYKDIKEMYSLDFVYDSGSLIESISDDCKNDPLRNMSEEEGYIELLDKIKQKLTKREYEVFVLMARNLNYHEIAKILNKTSKQIDNTMQRIKVKVKSLLADKNIIL